MMATISRRIGRLATGAGLALLLAAGAARAQVSDDWDTSRFQMTRDGLEQLLETYEAAASSDAYSDELRARARYEATLVRTRLREGDFQVGDQIILQVEAHDDLSDTFIVETGRKITLPLIGEISLQGVLRSELESHLTREIGRYIREPVVRARSLIRISVLGAVGQPGFYTVPAEALFEQILMTAGGPASNAKLTEVRIERGTRNIWEGEPLQQAIIEGRTVDQLSLRAGDRIVVPEEGQRNWGTIIQVAGILSGLIYGVTRIIE